MAFVQNGAVLGSLYPTGNCEDIRKVGAPLQHHIASPLPTKVGIREQDVQV